MWLLVVDAPVLLLKWSFIPRNSRIKIIIFHMTLLVRAFLNPAYTKQPVVNPVGQPAIVYTNIQPVVQPD